MADDKKPQNLAQEVAAARDRHVRLAPCPGDRLVELPEALGDRVGVAEGGEERLLPAA